MPEAISNASPLIQLAKIDQLTLLAQLQHEIPELRKRRLLNGTKGDSGAHAGCRTLRGAKKSQTAVTQRSLRRKSQKTSQLAVNRSRLGNPCWLKNLMDRLK
jgi:hypothetical protein